MQLFTFLILMNLFIACGYLPPPEPRNKIYVPDAANVPRASLESWDSSNVFVGMAISGGGSRAANFSAAVLEQLTRHGFTKHLSAVSSVSGGSLTAAYYALHSHEPSLNWSSFYEKLREDLEATPILCSWRFCRLSMSNPLHLLYMSATRSNRSDLMAGTFDHVFFKEKQFRDLSPVGFKLILNVTPTTYFWPTDTTPFLESHFKNVLYSRLDTFPISQAVMASGAFPGAFPSVTLKYHRNLPSRVVDARKFSRQIKSLTDHRFIKIRKTYDIAISQFISLSDDEAADPHYLKAVAQNTLEMIRSGLSIFNMSDLEAVEVLKEWFGSAIHIIPVYSHLYDGGPTDNWGLNSIKAAAEEFSKRTSEWKGCFIFLLDAYPDIASADMNNTRFQADTRQEFLDYVIDTNALDASDVLFNKDRRYLFGEDLRRTEGKPFIDITIDENTGRRCQLWHITFRNFMFMMMDYPRPDRRMSHWMGSVPYAAPRVRTRYKLAGLENCSAEQHQQTLRAAAWLLVNNHVDMFYYAKEARKWFEERNLVLEPFSWPAEPPKEFDTLKLIAEPTPSGLHVYCE